MGEPEYASQRHICHAFLSERHTVIALDRAVAARRYGARTSRRAFGPRCSRIRGLRESSEPGDTTGTPPDTAAVMPRTHGTLRPPALDAIPGSDGSLSVGARPAARPS